MSDFKAKMHKIRFTMGSAPDPTGGAYSVPPDPLAVFKGPTSKGRGEGEGKGREGKGGARPRTASDHIVSVHFGIYF